MPIIGMLYAIVKPQGIQSSFNGSQLPKLKKYIPHMSLPWNL